MIKWHVWFFYFFLFGTWSPSSFLLVFLPEGFASASQEQQVSVTLVHPSPRLSGGGGGKKQSHQGTLLIMIYMLCFEALWGGFSGACGVKCVVLVWMREGGGGGGGRLERCWESVGDLLKPAGGSGGRPRYWKPFCLSQSLSYSSLSPRFSSSYRRVINLFPFRSRFHPGASWLCST